MPSTLLDEVAAKKGLSRGEDLEVFRQRLCSYLEPKAAPSILEIGAGAGRVVSWLNQRMPRLKIVGIDYSAAMVERLRARFAGCDMVDIRLESILSLDLPYRFDAALWLWSAFTELHPSECQLGLERAARHLNDGGLLFIDIPREIRGHGEVTTCQNGFNEVSEPYGTLITHTPVVLEIERMARAAGFSGFSATPYLTSTSIPRLSLALTK